MSFVKLRKEGLCPSLPPLKPCQFEAVHAMVRSLEETKESFVAFWPKNSGVATLFSHFLIYLEAGQKLPEHVCMLYDNETMAVTAMRMSIGKPVKEDDEDCRTTEICNTWERKKCADTLYEALPRLSRDLIDMIVAYSMHGKTQFTYVGLDKPGEMTDLQFDMLLARVQDVYLPWALATNHCPLSYVFVRTQPSSASSNFPLLSVCDSPKWEHDADCDHGWFFSSMDKAEANAAKQRVLANEYRVLNEKRREALKCTRSVVTV